MARKQREIECVVTFTEGCEKRFTKAILDIYEQRQEKAKLAGAKPNNLSKEKTA